MSAAAVRKGKNHKPADSKHAFCSRGRDILLATLRETQSQPNKARRLLCRCGGGHGRRQVHLSRQGAALPEGDVITHAAQQLLLCRILILQLLLQRHHLPNRAVLPFQAPYLPCYKRVRCFDTILKLCDCGLISALMFLNRN